jgi:hypothetical protein
MPSYPPRQNSTKKQEQLQRRQQELQHALRTKLPSNQLAKAVEKVRTAQVSLLKADLHWARQKGLKHFKVSEPAELKEQIANLQQQVEKWESMSLDEIIRAECSTLAVPAA